MRIVCPACAAAYEVPDGLITAARRTRCARCGETWVLAPEPEQPEAAPEPVVHDDVPRRAPPESLEPQPLDRLVSAVPMPPRPRGSGVWVGWVASLIILAGLGWAGYTYRERVMTVWPPSTRVYAALGLSH